MTLKQYVKKGSFFKAVVEDGSDIIFVVDFDGNIHYHNTSVHETLGYRSNSLIGKNFFDYVLPDTLEDLRRQFRQSQKRSFSENVEFQFRRKDLAYRFLEFNAINLKFKEGLDGFILDCRDIAQRKESEAELVRLQKAKEQFLANMSHEIRTPINGIVGMANLLGRNTSPEERDTYLSAIKHSAENLTVIINDILDLAAIESGKLKFEKIAFNLQDFLPSLISTFAYQAQEKRISIEYEVEEKLDRILLGDPVRLNQILINLISNAVKFTQTGSIKVICSIERQQKDIYWVRIDVVDTGIGIPKEKLNTIFESFSQADASVTRKYGGTGLGLTIVKQLVELQKGKISVKSKEHTGSTFTVLIPYTIGKATKISKLSPRNTSEKKEAKAAQLYVLLVEDNEINRLYAKSVLKNWHCITDTAENGLVAIEKIKSHEYDVVLMDIQMPIMDGYETTKAIRQMELPQGAVPILALTANATKADVDKCIASGMDDYLPKPFTPDDLYRKLFTELKIAPREKKRKKPSDSTRKLYNLEYLRSVSGNDEEFIREMILTFTESIPSQLEEMKNALASADWAQLARNAHQIKPSFTLMGLTALRSNIVFIEENSKTGTRLDEVAQVVSAFIDHCNIILPELAKEVLPA
ncbi:MAG: ATP-binding protein [Cyclobacteriaceae bacterium]|nr:ATP-binding protein [Cyclobacteriaceae bacterium]MDH4298130.1 ATP-binding protein [Cyclobacteriaceae bacterium]MDH5250183.1 ATP-binding protein [Cyclobacteriaceae bacterium]